jgi:hypothetical protein
MTNPLTNNLDQNNAVIVYTSSSKAVAVAASPETIEEAYRNAVNNSKIYIAHKISDYEYRIVEMPKKLETCICGPTPRALDALQCLNKSTKHTYLYSNIFWKSPLFTGEPTRYHATTLPKVAGLFERILRGERYTFDPSYTFKDKNGKEHIKEVLYHDKDPEFCVRHPGPDPRNQSVLIGLEYSGEPTLDAEWQTWCSKSSLVAPRSCRALKGVAQLHPLCQPAKTKLKNMGKAGLAGATLALAVGTGTIVYNRYSSQPSTLTQPSTLPTESVSDAYGVISC